MYVCIPAIARSVRNCSGRDRCSRGARAAPGAPARGCRGRAGTATSPASRDWSERIRPGTSRPGSRTTPTTVNVRDRMRAAGGRARRRRRWRSLEAHHLPDAVAIRPELPRDGFGHDHDARLRRAFRSREAAPAHDFDAEHVEVFGRHGQLVDRQSARRHRTCRSLHASAATTRPRPPPADGPSGPGAARRAVVRCSMETLTVSLVRTPGSLVAAARAPRRKMTAQIRRRADAPTWTAIRACRARPGRASLVTSPRIVGTRSRRVACSAGASPKNTVDTMAPATRNASTRQSGAGAARLNTIHELGDLRR